MTPYEYRIRKDNLLAVIRTTLKTAQAAAEAVDISKASGDEDRIEEATERYRRAVAAHEDALNEAGEDA